jgi:hypothetical protein
VKIARQAVVSVLCMEYWVRMRIGQEAMGI